MLLASVKSQRDFWEAVHKVSFKRKFVRNYIAVDDWFQHFRTLLEKEVNNDDITDSTTDDDDDNDDDENHTLNRPISEAEVLLALRKIKLRKAPGPDGIIGEIIRYSGNQVVHFFVKFFNTLFDSGIFPDRWTESIVIPLFKKGDMNNPSNYRGISLCDTSSKLYSTIINNRLREWVEQNNITGKYQAGSKEDILQLTICLLYWHVFRSNLLWTENSMLLLLISKRRLILLIEICYGLFC